MGSKEEDAAPTELGEINRDRVLPRFRSSRSCWRWAVRPIFKMSNAGTGTLETGSGLRLLTLRFHLGLRRSDFLPGRCAPQLQASAVNARRGDDVAIWGNHRGP